MKLPRGQLVRRRVVNDLGTPLENALAMELTGYARLEPQETLLLDADGVGVLVFRDGIPTVAYHTGTDSGGADALSDIAVAGPYRLGLYELDADILQDVPTATGLQVSPGLPAERLTGDSQLVERTREAAPDDRTREEETGSLDAVESFLEDEETITTIQERARDEAKSRADDWGFDVHAPDEADR
jgi:hypothetical protein